ncbi:hypothetical protein M3Y97_00083700 [Aphelenchoides bicaudatus]|nr:hypothetical protein M3Y97_00083700 [Aphelenchoides bicaudatus]
MIMRRFGRSLSGGISDCSREFLFRQAIQKNAAKFSSTSDALLLRPQHSEEIVELLDASQSSSMNADRTIFLGFITAESINNDAGFKDDFSSAAYSEFKRGHSSMDRALAECNQIKQRPGFNQGLLLKSVEPSPMFSFLHYAIFNSNQTNDRVHNSLADDPILAANSRSLSGNYEELYSIQKHCTFIEPSTLPSHRHAGFIVSNFKIMDRSRQQQLEKNWLYWSGAKEIYRYSPRAWMLRKITLLRVKTTELQAFAYVLLCEFGQILHPTNFIQAMDMCERLRGRVCGNFELYRVQYNYYEAENTKNTGIFRQPETVGSPRQSLSNSSSMNRPMQRLASPLKISRMGVSQDVDDGSSKRKATLYRMRDRSLGYETRFPSYHMFEELT